MRPRNIWGCGVKRMKRWAAVFAMAGMVALAVSATAARAGATWDGLREELYGQRAVLDGRGVITLTAPGRPLDQSNVPVSAHIRFRDGRTVKKVTFIVDENPSPVAADFVMGPGRSDVALSTYFRFNSATDVRVVAEASDGALYMVDRHTKFAGGQAACSAPPQGDPAEIAANTGKMRLVSSGSAARKTMSELRPKMQLALSHPNHTGMVLDQISLLYIPLKMVTNIEVRQGGDLVFAMTGSITLSQDPTVDFDYRVNGATEMTVIAGDTDGSRWERRFPIGHGS